MKRALFGIVFAGGIALTVYGFWEGVPERDLADAVHRGDRAAVQKLLAWRPGLAGAKVYPQGMEPWRTGRFRGPADVEWRGRYLIHDIVGMGGDPAMLELLAASGAELDVRLEGRTLLHEAARGGNVESAAWLLDHGADIEARNDCADPCAERGRTALHDAISSGRRDVLEFLLARGAAPGAADADGRTALHLASSLGSVDDAWVLCRYGAEGAVKDAQGRAAPDVAADAAGEAGYGPGAMADWLKPGGACDTLAARRRASGLAVDEDEARVVFAAFRCARGVAEACTPPR
ncbi:MAG: ankyrin repeat domain-containing protein [Acidobacteriota bacterium]|nr:ankyrin repeat domain-containing protein [Acidobacteriota bacterium]